MFGKKKGMIPGKAKILMDEGPVGYTGMVGDPTMNAKYIVEVQPEHGPSFRSETKAKVELVCLPGVGDILNVLYDPDSHNVELQIEGDPRFDSKVQKRAQKARRDELLGGGPSGQRAETELERINRETQHAIERLQAAEERGAPQAELDELMQAVNDGIQRQEDLM